MTGFIDSMARGIEGQALTNFVRVNGLSLSSQDDWTEDTIAAVISGRKLDNLRGNTVLVDSFDINDEWLVHLKGRRAKCVVNLSVLIAMAAAFCLERQQQAAEQMKNWRPKVYEKIQRNPALLPNGHKLKKPAAGKKAKKSKAESK